jgi:hypothetical protein
MRPLPRLHAFTDASLLSDPQLGIRAAAIAAAGPAVALHVRARGAKAALLAAAAGRLLALARPPEGAGLVSRQRGQPSNPGADPGTKEVAGPPMLLSLLRRIGSAIRLKPPTLSLVLKLISTRELLKSVAPPSWN